MEVSLFRNLIGQTVRKSNFSNLANTQTSLDSHTRTQQVSCDSGIQRRPAWCTRLSTRANGQTWFPRTPMEHAVETSCSPNHVEAKYEGIPRTNTVATEQRNWPQNATGNISGWALPIFTQAPMQLRAEPTRTTSLMPLVSRSQRTGRTRGTYVRR